MNSVYYLNRMNYFSAQTLTFCVFIVITCEQSKTDHFITFVCRIGGTTPIIQLKIKKRITRFFLVRVKPTYVSGKCRLTISVYYNSLT